jgi:hypothetical protein
VNYSEKFKTTLTLDVDKNAMTIIGVKFDNKKEFRIVWNAISSNMIEGWNPSVNEVERLKEQAISMRGIDARG